MKGKRKIMLVDDEAANLEILIEALEQEYDVVVATNGERALKLVRDEPQPSLILLDVVMPGMDGYEVCRRVKGDLRTSAIPVMFITARSTEKEEQMGLELGAVDYITKPFSLPIVQARVRSVLKLYEQNLELQAANEKLQELDKMKSMFIASMSHELRTPLNSIIGFTGIILQGLSGELNEKQREQLTRVKLAGQHLLALVSDVMDISKIEAGRIEANIETFSLGTLIRDVKEQMEVIASSEGFTIVVEMGEDVSMQSDRRRLHQCLINFLSNAVKFTDKSGAIVIRVEEKDENVSISVIDNGIGIAREDIPKLFEAFERLETHLRVKAGGSGLGLYLTRKIIESLLEGEVWVKSTLGQGSTFGLTIPKTIKPKKLDKA